MNKALRLLLLASLLALFACSHKTDSLDLSGTWQVSLDSLSTFQDMQLPSTTDLAGLGEPNKLGPGIKQPQIQRLTRRYSFLGEAFYKREIVIPKSMANKPLELKLERVIWQSSVWVDGIQLQGAEESLTTPHFYLLPSGLSAGRHELMLRIDNRKRYDLSWSDLAHAYTNDTQVMWNGVLGEISLSELKPIEIAQLDVYPDPASRTARVRTILVRTVDTQKTDKPLKLTYKYDGATAKTSIIEMQSDTTIVEDTLSLGRKAELWDEFSPALHSIELKCGADSRSATFGLRSFTTDGKNIVVNGRNVFLRGTLNCCIYPLTGNPPLDEEGWVKEFEVCKAWGLNHVRFHSWCPPEAAFKAADKLGLYLQVELPDWARTIGNPDVDAFLLAEYNRIIANYGNHPSFCMLTCGNELDRGYNVLNEMLRYMKKADPRHIYSNSSYSMGAGHKGYPEPQDQFMIASRTYLGQIRGQDYLGSREPDFTKDYEPYAADFNLPLISHEIGQYSVYPHLSEIDKYTGTLDPLNFKGLRDILEARGRLSCAEDYTMASGRLAAILYKEEVERALKTPQLGGFQLLGLQDFSGQGSALVGLVDAFWDNKGLVSEDWFRQACAPVTPLVRYSKPCWTSGETFSASVEVANYWSKDIVADIEWRLLATDDETSSDGRLISAEDYLREAEGRLIHTVADGVISSVSLPTGSRTKIDQKIYADLIGLDAATHLTLVVSVKQSGVSSPKTATIRKGTYIDVPDYSNASLWTNSWDIWVYPQERPLDYGEVVLTDDFDKAMSVLSEGGTVLFSPASASIKGVSGKFVPVFWSPVFFPAEAGTMGLLCDPNHPALALFPTQMNSNWQWWHLTKNSKALDIEALPKLKTIVEAVDNFTQNRRLAYIFEAECESGRLIFTAMDLLPRTIHPSLPKNLPKGFLKAFPNMVPREDIVIPVYPETRQMLISLLDYMNSPSFHPTDRISKDELAAFLEN